MVPFSVVDPGWGMEEFYTDDPCKHLGVLIMQARRNSVKFKKTLQHELFNWEEIFIDYGKSGPGVIDITADQTLAFREVRRNGDARIYSWVYAAEIRAMPNLFDFDPKDWGTRSLYKELITRGIYITPGGTNFWVFFSGKRVVSKAGSCCCKKDSYFPVCKKNN